MKKRILYILIILSVVLTVSTYITAASIPRIAIGSPSSGTVEAGGTISYTINIYNSATSVTLKPSDIRITGVSANISVQGSGNSQRTIVLSNIQGSVGSVGYISYIAGGVATNAKGGNREFSGNSTSFTIIASQSQPVIPPNNPQPTTPDQPTLPPQQPSTPPNNNNSTPIPQTPTEKPQENPNPTEEKDETKPTIHIGNFSSGEIEVGKTISFDITYEDNKEMGDITLENKDITLYGFKADIKITGEGNKRTITLSNVQGDLGGLKYAKIAPQTAKDKAGNVLTDGAQTGMFRIINNDTKGKPADWIQNPNTGR